LEVQSSLYKYRFTWKFEENSLAYFQGDQKIQKNLPKFLKMKFNWDHILVMYDPSVNELWAT